jgi:hypothetical protein
LCRLFSIYRSDGVSLHYPSARYLDVGYLSNSLGNELSCESGYLVVSETESSGDGRGSLGLSGECTEDSGLDGSVLLSFLGYALSSLSLALLVGSIKLSDCGLSVLSDFSGYVCVYDCGVEFSVSHIRPLSRY